MTFPHHLADGVQKLVVGVAVRTAEVVLVPYGIGTLQGIGEAAGDVVGGDGLQLVFAVADHRHGGKTAQVSGELVDEIVLRAEDDGGTEDGVVES